MPLKSIFCAGFALAALTMPGFAGEITIDDAYARVSTKMSKSGAAFMMIKNAADADDRLIAASSDVADRVELHTHKENEQGVMQMIEVEEGFAIPAGGGHALARGGDHVMFLGLNQSLNHGDVVTVTLTFEKAGEMIVEIPVDLQRKPKHGAMGHGHGHGAPKTN